MIALGDPIEMRISPRLFAYMYEVKERHGMREDDCARELIDKLMLEPFQAYRIVVDYAYQT